MSGKEMDPKNEETTNGATPKPEENGAAETAAPDNVRPLVADPEKAELEKAKSEILYLRAEFDNFRKRTLREQETSVRFANERIIKDFVPIADWLEKALDAGRKLPEGTANALVSGVEATFRELVQTFGRAGAELVGTVGETFDPARHEALTQAPSPKDLVGKVVAVAARGCVLHGRTLKPAQVVVGIADTSNA